MTANNQLRSLPQDHTIIHSVWLLPERRRQSYTNPSVPHKHRRAQPFTLPTSAPCLDWTRPAHDCARTRFAPAVPGRPRQAVPSARVLGTRPSGHPHWDEHHHKLPSARVLGTRPSGRSHLGRAPPQASVRPYLARGQVGDPTWDEHRTLPSAGGSHGSLRPDVGDGVPFGERVGGIADHFAVPSSPGADVAGVSPVSAQSVAGVSPSGIGPAASQTTS